MMRYRVLASCILLACVLAGCTQPDGLNRGGSLSGKVMLGDQPLGGGRVELFSADGQNSVSCQIGPEGQYKLSEPPLGECKVVVTTSFMKGLTPPQNHPERPERKGQPAAASAGMVQQADVGYRYTPIPAKYESPTTTDLTVTVTRGQQTQDLVLAPR